MFNKIADMFAAMPPLQLALFISWVIFSTFAVNAVFALHCRRVGKPVLKSMLTLFSFPILDLNAKEWLLLVGAFSISLLLMVLAVRFG